MGEHELEDIENGDETYRGDDAFRVNPNIIRVENHNIDIDDKQDRAKTPSNQGTKPPLDSARF